MADTISAGYCGDDECDEMVDTSTTSQSSDDESFDDRGSWRSNKHRQFFAHLPSRRNGDVDDLHCPMLTGERCERRLKTSQYSLSRMLLQYFADQNPKLMRTPESLEVSDDSRFDAMVMQVEVPLITSVKHILMQEAISFSTKPRVVIEAESPYRVVHTNAAYVRRYGTSPQPVNSFQNLKLSSHRCLGVAVNSLFDAKTHSLVMYPVCESYMNQEIHPVTHFLIEAINSEHLPDKLDRNRWSDTLAQVIA